MQIRLQKIAILGFFIGFLINSAALSNDSIDNVLHRTFKEISEATLQEFIKAGIDVNCQDDDGNTVLHKLSEIIVNEYLFDDIVNNEVYNPDSVYAGSVIAKAKILLDAGIDVNITNKSGLTALDRAIGCCWVPDANNKDLALLLIEPGAVLNRKGYRGNTLLHIAYSRQMNYMNGLYFDVLLPMLEHGADISIKNEAGKTVLDCIVDHIILYQANEDVSDYVKILKFTIDMLHKVSIPLTFDKNLLIETSLQRLFDTIMNSSMNTTCSFQFHNGKQSVQIIDVLRDHGIFAPVVKQ